MQTLSPFIRSNFSRIDGTIKQIGFIKNVYLINLPHRFDRRLVSIGVFQTLGINAFIVPGVLPNSTEIVNRFNLTKTAKISPAEIACWESHLKIWNEIALSPDNQSWALILEDDVDLEVNIVQIVESFSLKLWNNPDMIYFGHCDNLPGALFEKGINEYAVHIASHPSCTHAYAIRRESAIKLIQLAELIKPIDDHIVDLHRKGKLFVVSFHPPLAVQHLYNISEHSDIDNTLRILGFPIIKVINRIFNWFRGIEVNQALKNSTVKHADLEKAKIPFDSMSTCPGPFCTENVT